MKLVKRTRSGRMSRIPHCDSPIVSYSGGSLEPGGRASRWHGGRFIPQESGAMKTFIFTLADESRVQFTAAEVAEIVGAWNGAAADRRTLAELHNAADAADVADVADRATAERYDAARLAGFPEVSSAGSATVPGPTLHPDEWRTGSVPGAALVLVPDPPRPDGRRAVALPPANVAALSGHTGGLLPGYTLVRPDVLADAERDHAANLATALAELLAIVTSPQNQLSTPHDARGQVRVTLREAAEAVAAYRATLAGRL